MFTEQAEHRDHHHDAAEHRAARLDQPLDRLVDDPRGDGEQRKPVGEGDQHLEAVEAVGALPVGRAARSRKPNQASASEAKSVSMWPASASSASEPATMPPATSANMKSAGDERRKPDAPLVASRCESRHGRRSW